MAAHDDPRKGLEQAKGLLAGKGIMGWLTRLFMGKAAVEKMSAGVQEAEGQLDIAAMQQRILASGSPAKALVQKIEDTGTLVNFNPVVRLSLKVRPPDAAEFEVTIKTAVSNIAVPRVGEVISIKYNPQNKGEIAIVPG